MINLNKWIFRRVPAEQRQYFLDFVEAHPFKIAEINGRRWKYISCGSGEKTILLLHGMLVDANMFIHQISEFEKDFRIIVPNYSLIDTTPEKLCEDLNSLLEYEKIDKVILLGFSLGGTLSQFFVRKHPEKVERMILSNTRIPDKAASIRFGKKAEQFNMFPTPLIKILTWRKIKRYPFYSPWADFTKAYFDMLAFDYTRKKYVASLRFISKFALEREIEYLDENTWYGGVLLISTTDDKISLKQVERIKKLYKNVETYIFDEGGHYTLLLYPEKYNKVLNMFLKKQGE